MTGRTLLLAAAVGLLTGCSAFQRKPARTRPPMPPPTVTPLAVRPAPPPAAGLARVATDPEPVAVLPPAPALTPVAAPAPPPLAVEPTDPVPTRLTSAPHAESAPAAPADPAERLHAAALARYAALPCFECRLTRREWARGKLGPEEIMRYRFRKSPYSVHLKWLGKEGGGREMIYVRGRYKDEMQILTADGDVPFSKGGKRMSVSPDSFMVKARSRHSVRDAGLQVGLTRLGQALSKRQAGRREAVTHLGALPRQDYDGPLEGLEMVIYPGEETLLPKGGRRVFGFDANPASYSFGLPVLILTRDESGREVEYFRLDRFMPNVTLDDRDFDPAAVYGK